jgi:hypothetical protein
MCRRWAGGPFLAVDCNNDVDFGGQEHVSVFNSSDWADRGFCAKCGTHLYYHLKKHDKYVMPVGLFDDDAGLVFDHQVFIDAKPEYYRFENETKDMTGEELFAAFSAC